MKTAENIIKRPLLTEKGTRLKEGGGSNAELGPDEVKAKVIFEVDRDANKADIRRAVEKLWNVNVLSVRTSIVRGKQRRVGRYQGRRPNWKKAVVTLAPGQNIEFFEGV